MFLNMNMANSGRIVASEHSISNIMSDAGVIVIEPALHHGVKKDTVPQITAMASHRVCNRWICISVGCIEYEFD